MPLRLATTVALTAALAAPAPAAAQQGFKHLWATVNVCDTRKHPDEIGLRASMPGLRRPAVMWMRFRVQHFVRAERSWRHFTNPVDSGWIRVGRQRGGAVQSGWSRAFEPPEAGASYRLRGFVNYRWKRRGKVVMRARDVTTGGHRSTKGADPRRFSAASCTIR